MRYCWNELKPQIETLFESAEKNDEEAIRRLLKKLIPDQKLADS